MQALRAWVVVRLAELKLEIRQVANAVLHGHEAFAAWHVEVVVFHQGRIGDPWADADGIVIGLGLVDIVHNDADVVKLIEDRVHGDHSLTGTV